MDLLITDISMPAPDGLQVIKEARAIHANITTLAMTGYLAQYSTEDVQACGAKDLIYKPLRDRRVPRPHRVRGSAPAGD